MNDLFAHVKAVSKVTLFGLAICLLLWVFVPEINVYAAGFALGMTVSLLNAFLLAYKINTVTKQIVEQTRRRVSLGFVSRLSMCLIAVMLANRSPHFDLAATMAGFFYVPIVTLVLGVLFKSRK